jgi:hypothetical protein
MSPLVIDTISNLSGEDLYDSSVRIPLFLFLLTLVLGSYAVLAAWTDAIRERNVMSILRISAVELVAVLLEVLFLYREFVDALVPWFAMHMEQNFEPSAALILGIAFMIWLGVRGMTWFLFGSYGTPVLLAVIRGEGLQKAEAQPSQDTAYSKYSATYMEGLRKDMDWLNSRSLEMLGALILPPMQLVAACLNFLLLLISGKNPIRLPLKDLSELAESARLLHPAPRKNGISSENPQAPRPKGVLS